MKQEKEKEKERREGGKRNNAFKIFGRSLSKK
jgi:hypothetical protein